MRSVSHRGKLNMLFHWKRNRHALELNESWDQFSISILVAAGGGTQARQSESKGHSMSHLKMGVTTLSDDDMKDIIDRLQMATEDLKRREAESKYTKCDFCYGAYIPRAPVTPVGAPIGSVNTLYPAMACNTCMDKIISMVSDIDWLRFSLKRYVMVGK